ncbi:MAG: electron transfer flavoprotein subunit alpha/FixB family protein [Acidobacteria bacterium]|nr:electron transfer flavoprotein subunit alpha/FixB family protein [Acidobacteriota bacterium]
MSVVVVIELQDGAIVPMSWEALVAGGTAADALGESLIAVALGSDLTAIEAQLSAKPVSEVVLLEHPLLERYTADGYVAALASAFAELKPKLALFPHTYQVRDFGPKLAARMGRAFVSDAVGLGVEDGRPVFVRQMFQGKFQADVTVEGEGTVFASIQSGSFRADVLVDGPASPLRRLDVALSADQIRTKPLERFRETAGAVDLSSAERIVSVGRGIKDPENLPLVEKLAAALGAEVAASRPICDNGWLPLERQVGSSGQTVAPKLYLALGISGAIQHVVGMKGSKTIVAVNKDASAPIFEIADYGIVGDLFEVAPALIEALERSS